jgi:raffinose/stachyose/melibiose transport system substrate-binding protein
MEETSMLKLSSRRRFLAGVAVVAASGLVLTACGGSSGGSSSSNESKSLRMFTYDDAVPAKALREQLAVFKKQTGISVTLDTLPGSGAAIYPDKLRTQLLGGSAPDVFRIWGGSLGRPFATSGQAAPLDAYYKKYGWDTQLSKGAITDMTVNGKIYGAPHVSAAVGAWYNKALFTKAGITSPPTTYAELEADNDKLVKAGITPVGLGGKFGWDVMRLFEYLLETTAGPEKHDQLLTGKASWDDPDVVKAFTLFKKWQDKGWLPKGAVGLDPAVVEPGFVQGTYAYTIAGQWVVPNAIKPSGKPESDFGTFVLPTDQQPQRYSGFVEGFMIAQQSKNKDNAAKLINFLLQPGTQKALGNTLSAVTAAVPDKATSPLSAQWVDVQQAAPHYVIQDQAFPKQLADSYFQVQSDILQGKTTPEEAAKSMQGYVSQFLK